MAIQPEYQANSGNYVCRGKVPVSKESVTMTAEGFLLLSGLLFKCPFSIVLSFPFFGMLSIPVSNASLMLSAQI